MNPATIIEPDSLLLMLAALAAIVGLFYLSGKLRVREPGCGKCGYPIKGLTTFICPECGADRRDVGIRSPRRGAAPVVYVILWTALLFAFAYPFSWHAVRIIGPAKWWDIESVDFPSTSSGLKHVVIRREFRWTVWFPKAVPRSNRHLTLCQVSIGLEHDDGQQQRLDLDLRSLEYHNAELPPAMWNLDWVKSMASDPAIELAHDDVVLIEYAIRSAATAYLSDEGTSLLPSQTIHNGSGSKGQHTSNGTIAALWTGWLLLWLLGARILWRRRRAAFAGARARLAGV